MIIPFNQHYYAYVSDDEREEGKKYQNIYLEGMLKDEVSGIFNFALEGLFRLWNNDFHFSYSLACEKEKEKFKNEHNIVMVFFNECIEVQGSDSKSKIKSSELFVSFERFCKENHYNRPPYSISRIKFFHLLEQIIYSENLDIVKKKRKDSYYYVGIKLKDEI